MKQRITLEQINILSEQLQNKLIKWWQPDNFDVVYWSEMNREVTYSECNWYNIPKENVFPLFSIGQCINFLRRYDLDIHHNWLKKGEWSIILNKSVNTYWIDETSSEELIDALWKTILKVLQYEI